MGKVIKVRFDDATKEAFRSRRKKNKDTLKDKVEADRKENNRKVTFKLKASKLRGPA